MVNSSLRIAQLELHQTSGHRLAAAWLECLAADEVRAPIDRKSEAGFEGIVFDTDVVPPMAEPFFLTQ